MDQIQLLMSERAELVARLAKIDALLSEHAALQRRVQALLGEKPQFLGEAGVSSAKSSFERSDSGKRRSSPVVEIGRAHV